LGVENLLALPDAAAEGESTPQLEVIIRSGLMDGDSERIIKCCATKVSAATDDSLLPEMVW